jgi:glycosyltransferase involved in cell wall biosynthesis
VSGSSDRQASPTAADTAPLTTVIVGVYNHERYVKGCLDSVLNSDYPNIEVIVFDDASVDESDRAVREWISIHPGRAVIYIPHEVNRGLPISLNEAIDRASGEYVTMISADDEMLPNGIADRVGYLRRNPDKWAVFADYHVMDNDGNRILDSGIEEYPPGTGAPKARLLVDKLIPYELAFHWFGTGPSFLCRLTAFNEVGTYDESLQVEDWDMCLRLAARGRLGFCDTYVANYRVHSQNFHVTKGPLLLWNSPRIAGKNASLFHGLIFLRLYTQHQVWKYDRMPLRPDLAAHRVAMRVLFGLVSWSYELWGRLLDRRRVAGGDQMQTER